MDKREVFSNNLRYFMKIKGMTRNELADKTKLAYKIIAEKLDVSPLMLTEEQNITKIMSIVDNSEDSQVMLDIMIKLSKLSLEGKKYILNTIDMIDNLKQ